MAVVARTYARALFDAAKEQGKLDEIREELDTFVATIREVPELQALIRNPQLDPQAKAEALAAVLQSADEILRNFARLVAEKGRAPMLEEIAREYNALVAAEERILNVELTTAYRAVRQRGRLDRQADRGGRGPARRGGAHGRPRADRRRRPQGRHPRGGLERPRPARATSPRACRSNYLKGA